MKVTDYSPRTGYIESYLTGNSLMGVEIGVDVGAHAESLLIYCDIKKIWLIDPWPNKYMEGFCAGRLAKWRNKICMEKTTSLMGADLFGVNMLDFVYLDQEHDYNSVREDLRIWWGKIREGGIMGLRNYNGNEGLRKAADEFIQGKRHEVENYCNELLIFK